jgi:hypothetical protein
MRVSQVTLILNIRNKLSGINNVAKGYNYRMSIIFPNHLHVYEFVRRLKDEHEYRNHKSEESQVQVKKRKKLYDKINKTFLKLFKDYENGQLTSTESAIKSGKAVKIKSVKTRYRMGRIRTNLNRTT